MRSEAQMGSGRLAHRLLGVALLTLMAAAAGVDCGGGCGCGEQVPEVVIPATPSARMSAFAARMPAQTDLAFFFVEMEQVRETMSSLSKHFEGSLPLDVYRQEVRQVIGLDLLDKTSYEAAGVHPEGGFALGYYRGAPVALLYAPDKVKFESGVIAALKRNYRIEASNEPIPDLEGATLVKGKGVTFAYAPLGGGMVVVVGQAVAGEEERDCVTSLTEIVTLGEEASLGRVPGFVGFQKEIGDKWPASVYMNTPRMLSLYQSFDPSLKTFQKEILDAVGEQVRWAGIGGRSDGDQAVGRVFLGIAPETLAKVKGLDKPGSLSPRFKLMVSDKAYAFVRTSLNAEIFWREYYKLMPRRQQKYFQTIVENLKATTPIDLEKDVIENLTGHAGVVIYGIDPLAAMARRASERMTVVTLAAHLQVKAPAVFVTFMDGLVKELGGSVRKWSVPGGIVAYGFDPNSMTAPPFALYIKDDVVTVASTRLGDERVAASLLGEGPKLRDRLKGEASLKLVEGDEVTGLYINMPRVQQQLGVLGGQLLNNLLGTPKEVAMVVSMAEGGFAADGSVTFTQGEAPVEEEAPAPKGADVGGAP